MAIDLTKLVGQQIAVNGLNTAAQGGPGVTNITVTSVDTAAGLITGHNGNQTFVFPVSANGAIWLVGNSANAVLNLTN